MSDFNPRSPCGERRPVRPTQPCQTDFNPRSPCGERLWRIAESSSKSRFQSTLSLRRATSPGPSRRGASSTFQSTLSLRRATRACGDPAIECRFQSTLSLRRATRALRVVDIPLDDFNPRSPCGERLLTAHVAHGEGEFQSTLSLRRATHADKLHSSPIQISIHALLAESDAQRHLPAHGPGDFNPRSPCGERPFSFIFPLSRRGDFNPRSPCGERHRQDQGGRTPGDFNPRSPCGERRALEALERLTGNFNPRSPCGERR